MSHVLVAGGQVRPDDAIKFDPYAKRHTAYPKEMQEAPLVVDGSGYACIELTLPFDDGRLWERGQVAFRPRHPGEGIKAPTWRVWEGKEIPKEQLTQPTDHEWQHHGCGIVEWVESHALASDRYTQEIKEGYAIVRIVLEGAVYKRHVQHWAAAMKANLFGRKLRGVDS